jgi:hypothetical protein
MIQSIIDSLHSNAALLSTLTMQSWAVEGVRESDGQNRGPVVDAIHEIAGGDDEDAAPWCARAVQAAWRIAGWATGQALDSRISRSGSVYYMMHTTHRRLPSSALRCDHIGSQTPDKAVEAFTLDLRPGDALIRYTMRPGFKDVPFAKRERSMTHLGHTEIVCGAYSDGYVDTIGGNTRGQTDSRDGDGVYVHRRMYSIRDPRVVGFVRPVFHPLG